MGRAKDDNRKQPLVVGYLRVSTNTQDLESQRHEINDYAQRHKVLVSEFIEADGVSGTKGAKERRIDELLQKVGAGDKVIVSELSRLGRSTVEVLTLIKELTERGVGVVVLKQGLNLNGKGDMTSKVMVTLFSLFSELERDLISERTKAALAKKRAQGVRLGRPPGIPGRCKLDGKEDDIRTLYNKRVGITALSRIYDVSWGTMRNFLNKKVFPKGIGRRPQNTHRSPNDLANNGRSPDRGGRAREMRS